MTREEVKLKLNDFKSFKQYLFGDSEPDWSKFYDEETDIFMPPILQPVEEVEYQLDHYALWMVICVYELKEKPQFRASAHIPLMNCYPCQYACKNGTYNICPCRTSCPLVLDDGYARCGSAYYRWLTCKAYKAQSAAHDVAHLMWKEMPVP